VASGYALGPNYSITKTFVSGDLGQWSRGMLCCNLIIRKPGTRVPVLVPYGRPKVRTLVAVRIKVGVCVRVSASVHSASLPFKTRFVAHARTYVGAYDRSYFAVNCTFSAIHFKCYYKCCCVFFLKIMYQSS